ncbi:GGDEF domain-containing protein [Asticcacaulis sp. BYS171W]|uniref:diguanylate cyclase n=1 Tax=Asticcacaulis aquaticus TaxID=2984212 RepID=A0ABT5HTS7_9CAUL|nr:GGDEF domain-containing protein [Asticcacaulis aquaticus]MDC7683473.1 GGDEF domain-containing protein [Asticcacaulis aquaticus]
MSLPPPASQNDPDTPRAPMPGSAAGGYTASMQNLLQSHFGTVSALATPRPQTTSQAAPTLAETGEEWPYAARALIDSLIRENTRLKADMKALSEQAQAAEHLADHDVLTPTLNRRAFLRDMARAMSDCKRYGEAAVLIFLDMDGFKSINDTYGHAAGDAALIYVAELLKANVREGDSVGRMGGDEFAILLRHADLAVARSKAQKLEAELHLGTFEYQGLYLKTGGSFGVRAYDGQTSAEAWVSEADAAMFLVKKASR